MMLEVSHKTPVAVKEASATIMTGIIDVEQQRAARQPKQTQHQNSRDSVVLAVVPILQSIQSETDNVSRRSRLTGHALHRLYNCLANMPDMVAVFESSLVALRTVLEEDVPRLRQDEQSKNGWEEEDKTSTSAALDGISRVASFYEMNERKSYQHHDSKETLGSPVGRGSSHSSASKISIERHRKKKKVSRHDRRKMFQNDIDFIDETNNITGSHGEFERLHNDGNKSIQCEDMVSLHGQDMTSSVLNKDINAGDDYEMKSDCTAVCNSSCNLSLCEKSNSKIIFNSALRQADLPQDLSKPMKLDAEELFPTLHSKEELKSFDVDILRVRDSSSIQSDIKDTILLSPHSSSPSYSLSSTSLINTARNFTPNSTDTCFPGVKFSSNSFPSSLSSGNGTNFTSDLASYVGISVPSSFGHSPSSVGCFPQMSCPSLASLNHMMMLGGSGFYRPMWAMCSAEPKSPTVTFASSSVKGEAVAEEGAVTPQRLDTLAIASRVKEILQVHNLGQRLFGEAVLEMSQGSVSELLSKPKPWHMLSIKGREPFVKMQIWLDDPCGVARLADFQVQASVVKKKLTSCLASQSETSPNRRDQKKQRLFFSDEQKGALLSAYERDPYPCQVSIEALAREIEVGVKTVINWFHNHRMRAKQQQFHDETFNCRESSSEPLSCNQSRACPTIAMHDGLGWT